VYKIEILFLEFIKSIMMNANKSEYYPSEIVVKDIDPDLRHTPESLFQVLKRMRIGIISYVDMDCDRGKYPYATIHFEKWNAATTGEMRSQFEKGLEVEPNVPYLGKRAYMVDYKRRHFIRKKEEEQRRQKREEEEQRRRKKREEEEQRRQKEEEEERLQYINDASIDNDLEIDYGDEEVKFFKFNKKTGKMDYKGRQYTIYE